MKLAFIITNVTGGGAEKAILKICAALLNRGHDIDLVLLENLVTHEIPAGLTVHALTSPGTRLSKGVIGKWIAVRRLRRLMSRLAKDRPYDLIVSTLPFADELAVRAHLPRHWCRIANTLSVEISKIHERTPSKADRRLNRYRKLYGSQSLIAVSDGVAQDLRALLGHSHPRIERIYNPFDFSAIRAHATESQPLSDGPYVIHVGRLASQKRHDLLLDAWAKLDVKHKLVLLAPPDKKLSAMIAARGLDPRVIVAGFQSNPYPWMAGADLLVLCSDHEGLPNVIIEALAVGTPVVSTDCPSGPREILGKVFPEYLVPVGDVEALSQAIHRALLNPPDPAAVDLAPFDVTRVTMAYETLAKEKSSVSSAGT